MFNIPPPPPLLELDYSSLFILFSFVGGRGSVFPQAALDYVSRGWVGESHVMCDAHLFVLQIHASSFGTSWQGEMAWHKEVFYGLMVQDVTEFDFDQCSLFCLLGGEKKGERVLARGLFSQCGTCFAGCAAQDFCGC
jgi:hypothetical protein